jgi:hypothetical protein
LLDAITVERMGLPAAVVGAEKLIMTTGKGMAKLQGLPDFPVAVIRGEGNLDHIRDDAGRVRLAIEIAPQVESILLTGRGAES